MNAAAVPWPASTLISMPATAVPSQAPRPAGTIASGRRQARVDEDADHEAGQERPGGVPDAGRAVAVIVGMPADEHERQHAAAVEDCCRGHGGGGGGGGDGGSGDGGGGTHPATVASASTGGPGQVV